MITSTERHKLVSSRERGKRVITADIDFRVVEECCAVITAPFLVEAAKAEDLSKCNKTDDAAIIHCASADKGSTRAIATWGYLHKPSKRGMFKFNSSCSLDSIGNRGNLSMRSVNVN